MKKLRLDFGDPQVESFATANARREPGDRERARLLPELLQSRRHLRIPRDVRRVGKLLHDLHPLVPVPSRRPTFYASNCDTCAYSYCAC